MTPANPDHRSAVVLMIDGLSPRYLSPYGCTWAGTPALDWLAAESITFERAAAEATDLPLATRSFLSGRHPLACQANEAYPALAGCREAGVDCWLLTDDVQLQQSLEAGQSPLADCFDHVVALSAGADFADQLAGEIDETHLANCFAQVLQELPQRSPPFLLIVHLTSLSGVWDAPMALREKHRDEEDPDLPELVRPPNFSSEDAAIDPDEIHGFTCAYAAQLETLDTCLDVLLEEARQDGMLDNMLVCVSGLRGYPLGHHGWVGQHTDHLFSDATSVPLFLRIPHFTAGPFRAHQLVSPRQIVPWIADWLTGQSETAEDEALPSLECRVTIGETTRTITTPAWLMIDDGETQRLFVKPDDRWDVNPVQDRCHWIVEELLQLIELASGQLANDEPLAVGSLADELVSGLG